MALLNDGLAWNQDATDRRRLTWVTLILVPIFLVLAAVIPFIHVPEPERTERDTTPPQLARLPLEEEIQPEVPPVARTTTGACADTARAGPGARACPAASASGTGNRRTGPGNGP